MVFGDGVLGKSWDHEGTTIISALINEIPESSCIFSSMWGLNEKIVYEPGNRLFPDTEFVDALFLDFPASITVRNTFLLCINHSSYDFCYKNLNR